MDKGEARHLLIGKDPAFRREQVAYEGNLYDIVQLNIKDRRAMLNECKDDSGNLNPLSLQAVMTVWCTCLPGTNERVFDKADIDALEEQPCGSFVDQFAERALLLNNIKAGGDAAEKK